MALSPRCDNGIPIGALEASSENNLRYGRGRREERDRVTHLPTFVYLWLVRRGITSPSPHSQAAAAAQIVPRSNKSAKRLIILSRISQTFCSFHKGT